MNCLKCGTKIASTQVFCDNCLQVMEKYPVKPDAAVHIPQRTVKTTERKQPRKKESTTEQILRHKNSIIFWLILTIVVLCGVVGVLAWKLLQLYGGHLPFF